MTDPSEFADPESIPVADIDDQSGRGVHQLGYRGWSGDRTPSWARWTVISSVGVRRAWQNQWLKRILFMAWLPSLAFGLGFFIWEQAALYPEWRQAAIWLNQQLSPPAIFDQVRDSIITGDFASGRHTVWALLLNVFFRYPQAVLIVLVIGLIAPPLISQDIRSRAFLLYFSRPLTRVEYLLGKMATVWVYIAMITAVPALVLYVLGVMLSPNLSVIASTWDLPLRIVIASVVLMIPTSALALCLSSLTQESRYAGFAWFAVWILGWFTYLAVTTAEMIHTQQQMRQQNRLVDVEESVWTLLSPYHTLGRVESWVFGFTKFQDAFTSMAILIVVTGVSLSVLFRQISKPMRV